LGLAAGFQLPPCRSFQLKFASGEKLALQFAKARASGDGAASGHPPLL
jgi:hypothetical protein